MIPKVALFSYRGMDFSLPVEAVEHIIASARVMSLPLLHAKFLGMILHDDQAVPLLDLGQMFQLSGEEDQTVAFVVLVFTEFGTLGLPAQMVRQIVDRAEGEFEAANKKNSTGRIQRVFTCGERRYPLLDTTSLMAYLLE